MKQETRYFQIANRRREHNTVGHSVARN